MMWNNCILIHIFIDIFKGESLSQAGDISCNMARVFKKCFRLFILHELYYIVE